MIFLILSELHICCWLWPNFGMPFRRNPPGENTILLLRGCIIWELWLCYQFLWNWYKGSHALPCLQWRCCYKRGKPNANIIQDNKKGGELNIILDKRSGQNKENTVSRLIPCLKSWNISMQWILFFSWWSHKNSFDMLFNVPKTFFHSMEEMFKNLNHSKRMTVYQTSEKNFFDHDEFLRSLITTSQGNSMQTTSSPLTKISGVQQRAKQGIKHRIIMTIKECDNPDSKIENHNCIKSGFEIEERLLGPSKLKQALLERKNYITSNDLSWTQTKQCSQSL